MYKVCSRFGLLLLAGLLALGLLPLRVRGSESRERVLVIHSQSLDTQYRVYLAADLLDVLFGVEDLSAVPTAEETARYAVEKNQAAVLKADEAGEVSWSLSEAGWPDGVYLVVEESGAEAPCYVCVPAPDPDGEGWLYRVETSPSLSPRAEAVLPEIILRETDPMLPDQVWQEGAAFCAAALGAAAVMAPVLGKKQPKTNVTVSNTQNDSKKFDISDK